MPDYGGSAASGGASNGAPAKSSWDLGSVYDAYRKANPIHNWLFGGDASREFNKNANLNNYGSATAQLGQIAAGAPNRQAPQTSAYQLGPAAQLYGGQMDQTRGGALGVANQLGQIASGQQAGAGELAVNRQVSQATAAQAAAAHMARGANAALAYRNAARNTADIGLAGAGQAAQAQMADQQSALGQQAGLYSNLYGQDANVAAQNAQLQQQQMLQQGTFGQQANLANQQASLAQTAMNDQARIQALGQQLGWDQAKIDAEKAKAQVATGDQGVFSGLLQGVGGLFAKGSDERLKTDVADGGADADALMSGLSPRTFRYLDEKAHGAGNQLGIMAQHLARSKMGAAMLVKVDERGHMGFDLGKAAAAALAATARLHERLSAVEGKK